MRISDCSSVLCSSDLAITSLKDIHKLTWSIISQTAIIRAGEIIHFNSTFDSFGPKHCVDHPFFDICRITVIGIERGPRLNEVNETIEVKDFELIDGDSSHVTKRNTIRRLLLVELILRT